MHGITVLRDSAIILWLKVNTPSIPIFWPILSLLVKLKNFDLKLNIIFWCFTYLKIWSYITINIVYYIYLNFYLSYSVSKLHKVSQFHQNLVNVTKWDCNYTIFHPNVITLKFSLVLENFINTVCPILGKESLIG